MGGMLRRAAPVKNKGGGAGGKGGGGANGGKGGNNGNLVGAQPPANTAITYTWICNAANPKQIIITFSQPVVYNGGIPNWYIFVTGQPNNFVTAVTVNSPTQVTLTLGANANCTTGFLSIGQNDITFKGGQGQFVQSGKQTSGPQIPPK